MIKVKAVPHHITVIKILGLTIGILYTYMAIDSDPTYALFPTTILIVFLSIMLVPYCRQHFNVTYHISKSKIDLVRNQKIIKSHNLNDFKSAENRHGTVIIHFGSFTRNSIYIHPESKFEEIVAFLNR